MSRFLAERYAITAVLRAEVPSAEAEGLARKIAALPPVRSAAYRDPEASWKEFLRAYPGLDPLRGAGGNPMPGYIEIRIRPDRLTGADVGLVASTLRSVSHVEQVLAGEAWLPRLLRAGRIASWVCWGIFGAFLAGFFLVGRLQERARAVALAGDFAFLAERGVPARPACAFSARRRRRFRDSSSPRPERRRAAGRCSFPPREISVPRRGDRPPVRPPASPDGRGGRSLLLRRRPALGGGVPPRMEGGPLRPEMIPGTRRILSALLAAAVSLGILFPAPAPAARDVAAELRKERGRLLEMKAREEKTALELSEALRKEKLTKGRVSELQERLKRQRSLLSGIDRKVSALNERLERAEKEVRELEAAHGQARTDLQRAEVVAFEGQRAGSGAPWHPSARERERHLMRVYLGADAEDVARISRARERKEEELSGLERQVDITERKMAREQKVGETLLSRQEEERRRLADIEREKKRKEKELRSLRAKIARMESVVARVERQAKERERRAQEEGGGGAGTARESAEAPRRFASLSGGLSAPLPGKVVTRFGRQHDPTFDVTIENRGVEIEAASGAPVKAAGTGEVAFTGAVSGFGNVLILQHGSGLFSVYGKLDVPREDGPGRGQGAGRGKAARDRRPGNRCYTLSCGRAARRSIRHPSFLSTDKEP